MHLLNVWTENAALVGDRSLDFSAEPAGKWKWTLLPDDPSSLELLRLIALICGGLPWLERLSFPFAQLVADSAGKALVAAQLELHSPRDLIPPQPNTVIRVGVAVDQSGGLAAVNTLPGLGPVRRPSFGRGNRRLLFMAYGPDFERERGTADFDFSDPWFRRQRFRSLFEEGTLLTSAASFLSKLQYRVRKGRHPAMVSFARLCAVLHDRLDIPTGHWMRAGADLPRLWGKLSKEQQALLIPIIDAVRHTMDASPHDSVPLLRPGILVFNGLDSLCPPELLPAYAAAVDELFPNLQLVCTLSRAGMANFEDQRRQARLLAVEVPKKIGSRPSLELGKRVRSRRSLDLGKGRVLLVQVDGRLPNLALMKLATHFARAGKSVALARGSTGWKRPGVDEVHASCVFFCESSLRRVAAMRAYYGDRLRVGGSGIDVSGRLPPAIESLPADYDLYPKLAGRALGFLTRGCPARCAFCIVPAKEGGIRQVAQLDDLLEGNRRRELILLDDNILAFDGADELLEEMASRAIAVNFNQTLDILRVTPERANLLKRIKSMNARFTRSNYYFSLNNCRALQEVRARYDLFGFGRGRKENVQFVCMFGYNTTLAEDVERFRFLRSLPSAYVFVQEYLPIRDGPAARHIEFFDDRADELIDELISILFPQNMKSMEKYYRWLNQRYYKRFGRLNMPLTKTIFRYNKREGFGAYIAKHPPNLGEEQA